MLLYDFEAEKALVESIDCKFPYDEEAASAIIAKGWRISLNAAFCVLNELCRPPKSRVVTKQRLRDLIAEWAAGPDHPIKLPILRAAYALVDHSALPLREGVELMKRVAHVDGQHAALAIAYFATDSDKPEDDLALNTTDTEIRNEWDAKGF